MKTAMQELKVDILIEKQLGFITKNASKRIIDYIDNLYLEKEKEQSIYLIRFMRINDKMGKSVEDLYNEFINK